jgi:hypothetical protein
VVVDRRVVESEGGVGPDVKGQKNGNENGNGGGRWLAAEKRGQLEDGGEGWLVSAVVARVVCAASARVRRGILSGGKRYGHRGEGIVGQEHGRGDRVDISRGAAVACMKAALLAPLPSSVPQANRRLIV